MIRLKMGLVALIISMLPLTPYRTEPIMAPYKLYTLTYEDDNGNRKDFHAIAQNWEGASSTFPLHNGIIGIRSVSIPVAICL